MPIRRLEPAAVDAEAEALGAVLVDAVAGNASLGFMAGLALADAAAYWREVAQAPQGRVVFVADDALGVAGTVILAPMRGAFQPHRAEIAKLAVHRRARGRGLGAALLQAAEDEARRSGRSVLTLMTRAGSEGEALYRKLGWTCVGILEDDSLAPDGTPVDAAIFRKRL